ncbi:MAG: peptidylprolyl isomerase [Candidatus Omnitrophota bacterium]
MRNFITAISLVLVVSLVSGCFNKKAIATGNKVSFDYILKVNGTIIDSTGETGPKEYIQGNNELISGLESRMLGLREGETKTIVVPPTEAYGEYTLNAVKEVPKANLPENIVPEKGQILRLMTNENTPLWGRILDIKEENLLVDFNHPLAGKDLEFIVTIINIE